MTSPWKAATTEVSGGILVLVAEVVSVEATKPRKAMVSRVRRVTYIIGQYLWKLI